MKTLPSIIFLIQPNTYMAKVGTKKAYQSYMSIKKFQSSRIRERIRKFKKNNTKTIFVKIQKK